MARVSTRIKNTIDTPPKPPKKKAPKAKTVNSEHKTKQTAAATKAAKKASTVLARAESPDNALVSDSEPESEDVEKSNTATDGSEKCKIDWKDDDLNASLIAAISGDIQQGLFPMPNGKMADIKSNGQKKTYWQWQVAMLLFKDHIDYGTAFAQTLNCKDVRQASQLQAVWAAKIKNRLKRMVEITRQHIATLGKTGEGIYRVEDVDTTQKNEFVNKWVEINTACPWFLDMRALIAQRPNNVPAGLGDSTTDLGNINLLGGEDVHDVDIPVEAELSDGAMNPSDGFDILTDDIAQELDADNEDLEIEDKDGTISKHKRKASQVSSDTEDIKPNVKPKTVTSARPGSSKPATTSEIKKRTRTEEFSAALQSEEITRQKELELSKAKLDHSARIKTENIRTKREVIKVQLELQFQEKKEKRESKERLALQKMKDRKEIQLAKIRQSDRQIDHSNSPSLYTQDNLPPSSDPASGAALQEYNMNFEVIHGSDQGSLLDLLNQE